MFRPGDRARIRLHVQQWPTGPIRAGGETVEILRAGTGTLWLCRVVRAFEAAVLSRFLGIPDELLLEESLLQMASPECLATMEGRALSEERYLAEMRASWARKEKPDYELRTAVEDRLNGLFSAGFDFQGHWKNGSAINESFLADQSKEPLRLYGMANADLRVLLAAMEAETPGNTWIQVGTPSWLVTAECSYCGASRLALETDGKALRIAGKPCPHPNGLGPTEWELNVPSGHLVVANDLREWFPLPDGDSDLHSVNTRIGCRETALAYAATGMAHASVGNSCPGIYALGEDRYKIATPPADERWDETQSSYVPVEPAVAFNGERVAEICTDLWWYSIADLEEVRRRVSRFGGVIPADTVISVRPGVYRFKHDEDGKARDYDGQEVVYSTFEWIRDPDPVEDFLARYTEVEVNAHAYVQAQVRRWPTLYGNARNRREDPVPWSELSQEERATCWRRVADHTMCVIGGGVDWHEKGFPRAKVDRSIPDEDCPQFRAQHYWYPFSKPYGGLFEPKTLSPAFAKMAFRVLESIISFGMEVRDGEGRREVRATRKRMQAALARYRELVALHPDIVDPEYVAWVSDGDRADRWVEAFDLGPEVTDKHLTYIANQRWISAGVYAVEFDARKLSGNGGFVWHPENPGVSGCWASKENAQRFAIEARSPGSGEDGCWWGAHARDTSVPLLFTARIVGREVSSAGKVIVELEFDYGTPWMLDKSKRKGLLEEGHKAGMRLLTKEEYPDALDAGRAFFEAEEAKVQTLINAGKTTGGNRQ